MIDGGAQRTYAELRHACARLSAELAALDLPPGSRVALIGHNSFFWVAAYLAAMRVNTVVPLSEKLRPEDLAAQASWVGCAAALIDRRLLRASQSATWAIPVITDEALVGSGPTDWPMVAPRGDAALMFTSGTTSRPKAVRVTHANLGSNTSSIMEYLALGATDRMCVVLPFHYVFGASLLHTHLAAGGGLVLSNTFAFPETALDAIETHGCTGFAGVPSTYEALLRASTFTSRRLPSLRQMQQAGGRLRPDLISRVTQAQPQADLFVMYGQTEATARLSYLPPALLRSKPTSIGKGIPGVVLDVVDPAGRPVTVGEQGEIVASGDSISPGYFNDDEATAAKFQGGKLLTGDLGRVDEDGFIHITGRRSEFIKSWGYRISPQQVEEAALSFAGITGAAAVGVPDDLAGEAVTLAVTAEHPIDTTALLASLRSSLARHMVPVAIHVLPSLPLTSSGKVARSRLLDLLVQRGQ